MKGPGFPLELAALREFLCGACGSRLQLPASTTSYLCRCTGKPVFMTPVERPAAVSPDVSAFRLPVPEGEEVEEEVEEDLPLEPRAPRPAPKPREIPGRRRLLDDLAHFGDDVESLPGGEDSVAQNSRQSGSAAGSGNEHKGRSGRSRRRGSFAQSDAPASAQRSETAAGQRAESSADGRRNSRRRPRRSADNESQGSSVAGKPDEAADFGAGVEQDATPRDTSGMDSARGSGAGRSRRRRRRRPRGESESGDRGNSGGGAAGSASGD